MKNTFQLTFMALSTILVASAASITNNCTLFPVTFNGGNTNTPQTVNCPGFNAVAQSATGLSGVTLTYFADYQFATQSPVSVTVIFTPSLPPGVTWSANSTSIVVTGGFSSSGSTPAVPFNMSATGGVSIANFASAFNVQVASGVTAGAIGASTGGVQVTYNYLTAASPEPATLSLLTVSLLGLGLASRRRSIR